MLGIDARAARAAWTVFLVGLLIFLTYTIRRTLLIFTAALLLAYLLSPVVDRVGSLFPRERSRNISLAIVYVALLAVMITAGVLIGGVVVEQASNLAGRFPELVNHINEPSTWPLPAWLESRRAELTTAMRDQIEQHEKDVIPVLQRAGAGLLSVLSDLPFLVLVPILSFFLLKDGARIRSGFLDRVADTRLRLVLEEILHDVHVLLLQFMRSMVILCCLTFVFYGAFFLIVGVPYPVLLAAIGGLLEFLPFVGPLTAAVVISLVAMFSGFPHVMWLIIFFLAFRIFQDYVIQPYLMSSGIELSPLLVIFGVIAGEQIGGIPGMFLSIPVLATLRIVFARTWRPSQVSVVS